MLELASPKAHGVDGPDMGQDSLPRVASHVACIYAHRSLRCLLSTPELYESLAVSVAEFELEAFVNRYEVDHYFYFRFGRNPK